MKKNSPPQFAFRQRLARNLGLLCVLACMPVPLSGANRQEPPLNAAGAPVLGAQGQRINYSRERLTPTSRATESSGSVKAERLVPITSVFVPAAATASPLWQYSIFGSGIGASNIVIGPIPAGGGAPEVIVGGSSTSGFGDDDFWQAIRRNPVSGNYDQVFVSPVFSAAIKRIGLADVVNDSNLEIVVMLTNGRIYLYDFASKVELGYLNTGISGLEGMSLTDLDGNGRAELIVTTANNLYVVNDSGNVLWQVAGAGGYDVVVGQMDNDAALEIATTSGKVVDTATHLVQWTRNGGFGVRLRLAPFPGENYQQLIVAESWQFVYSYDVARQLPRWSINTPQDIGAIQVADVDNDGTPEVIIGDNQWGTVHVHDLITQAQKWAAGNPEHGVTNIAVGDTDGDGQVDLLWGAGWTSSGVDYLYVANTTGAHAIKWQNVDLQGPFLGPLIGDLDGDGQPELVVCSYQSASGYDSGRILVFDLATLALRAISAPVVNNHAGKGVRDLKLRDLEGDGRMEIVIGADNFGDGAIEIYGLSSSNVFSLKWSNTTRPSGSPFNFVDVVDLDGNGIPEIIAGNGVADTGSPGVYVYIYDYPSGTNPWRSVNLASGFSGVTGLVVADLDGNGSKDIAALIVNGDLYTFDGSNRQLRNLWQATGFKLLGSGLTTAGLIAGDSAGVGHFLQYGNNSYTEKFTRQLGSGDLNGINFLANGALWVGNGSVLNLRLPPPAYNAVAWQSTAVGNGIGRFVVADVSAGQNRVFSSTTNAVVALAYTPNLLLATAVSRKSHGGIGNFDVDLPLSGGVGIECRGLGDHTIVFRFTNGVVSGNATVTSGSGMVSGSPTFSGNEMTVNLSGVGNGQRTTISLGSVKDSFSQQLPAVNFTMGTLLGDVDGSGNVTGSDVNACKAQVGANISTANFRADVNLTGSFSGADVNAIKAQVGTALP